MLRVLGPESWVLGPETLVLGPRSWVLGHFKLRPIKGTVSVISSDPPCKEAMSDIQRFISANFSIFPLKQEMRKSL